MTAVPKLRLEHVTKRIEIAGTGDTVTVVDGIDLSVAAGEFLVLVGPSGSGKSALLELLAGVSSPTSGRILLDGKPTVGPGLDRGIVFQHHALLPWRTARHNIEFGLETKGVGKRERRALTEHYLELVDLQADADHYPHELSDIVKLRVALARSLAFDPEVLLMDEPFGAFDNRNREFMQDELLRIREVTGKTIVFATSDIGEAVYLGQRVAVLTARPGHVAGAIAVDLDRSVADVRTGARFLGYRDLIRSLVDEQVERSRFGVVATVRR
ncbi:NitT/TauT family transport system ATP-binding protein [Rhodococcus sp. 27YEA15]|uniref:ABC transporter ATP-binding protein n=1 Tax=Rhodococcus sp. 27YEA15 TaxID=3156259 RepID=UPI003C7EC704